MMRPVSKQYRPTNGLDPPPDLPLRQTLYLKCGHFARRKPIAGGGLHVLVHCEMCTMLAKERESKDEKRAAKKERRRVKKFRQQLKVERLLMAKKKMAPSKVAKKKDLKKKGKPAKEKKAKGGAKAGRKLVLVASHLWAPKGSLLAKVVKAMEAADDKIMGENELVVAMEKAGVKAEGKKTVKKLVKGILRNMLRAGVVAKQREIKHNPELKAFIGGAADEDDEDESEDSEDADESEDEDGDESESEDESEDESGDDEDGDDEEEKPKAKKKKKVVGKKK